MDNVTLSFAGHGGPDGASCQFEVSLRKEDTSNTGQPTNGGSIVIGTTNPHQKTREKITYTTAAIDLETSANYWIWLKADVGGDDRYVNWKTTTSDTDGGASGWSLANTITKCSGPCINYDSTTEDYAGLITIRALDKGKVTAVTLNAPTVGQIAVSWTAVAGADGYKVQGKSGAQDWSSARQNAISGGGATTMSNITGLTTGTVYSVRVVANKSSKDATPSETHTLVAGREYDTDNDNLIEFNTLTRLDAIRYDLDGNGAVEDNMGCNESAITISSATGNPACSGYELSAHLDFDTGTKGTSSDDDYYNNGQGWQPIGGTFNATFEGNAYTISNLHINRSGATTVQFGGLFGRLGSSAKISNLKLKGVSVTVTTNAGSSANPGPVYAGGVAGENARGEIIASYVTGTVQAVQGELTNAMPTEGDAYAGGLAGYNTGDIAASFARGIVKAEQKSTTAGLSTYAGGLAGYTDVGSVKASYANVDAEAKTAAAAMSATLTTGGLVGELKSGKVIAS